MSNDRNANDLLMGSGTPAVKFDAIGDGIKGTVQGHRTVQQRDYKSKAPLFWENGKPSTIDTGDPVMQPVFTLFVQGLVSATDEGKRDLYCGSKNIREAVRDAVLKAGASQMEMGAMLTVQYVAGSGQTGDPKQYTAVYERPTVPVDGGQPAEQAAPAATGSIIG